MILTRITRAIREQNWFAVALEFIIVVSGVFLAFQASTWQAAIDQRESARESLRLMLQDLEADSAQIALYDAVTQWRYSALNHVLEGAGAEMVEVYVSPYGAVPTPPAAPFDPGPQNDIARPIVILQGLDIKRHTYDSMINLGTFQHIDNAELTTQIHAYYSRVDAIGVLEGAALAESRAEVSRTLNRLGVSALELVSPDDMIALAREHPQLRAEIGGLAGATQMQFYNLYAIIAMRDALHAAISAELGETP